MIKKKDLGIYIHIPFCAHKCDYCDFCSGVASRGEIAYYMRTILKEIRGFEPLGNLYQVRTVFFGGGTPSYLEAENLNRIMTQLRNQFLFTPDAEITVECNPGTLTEEKLRAYRAMGVNRLSMGLQSANNEELALLGRIHTWETFLENYQLARQIGFDNINVDLMSALPKQKLATWKDTLAKVAALAPEHISAYSLILEEGTPFYERYTTTTVGKAMIPTEDEDREMYHYTGAYLAEQGYGRYEISNYAKEGRECRHNIAYWTGGEYIGFGMSAASYLMGCRFANPSKYNDYWDYAPTAYQSFRKMTPQSKTATVEEFMFLGLRMMRGISTGKFEERFQIGFDSLYGKIVERMIRKGLMERENEWVRLTELGIDVSNRVLAEFLLDEELT